MKLSKEPSVVVMTQKEVEYQKASLLGISRWVKKSEKRISSELIIHSNDILISRIIVDGVVYTPSE